MLAQPRNGEATTNNEEQDKTLNEVSMAYDDEANAVNRALHNEAWRDRANIHIDGLLITADESDQEVSLLLAKEA